MAAAHPVVVFLQSVEADGEGAKTSRDEFAVHFLVVEPAIADNAPADAAFTECFAYFGEVGTEKRFASGDDDGEGVGSFVLWDGVECAEEVLERHVLFSAAVLAVAATVAAVEVAARGAFPEEVVEFVDAGFVGAEEAEEGA